MIYTYKNPVIYGAELICEETFAPHLDIFCDLLEEYLLKALITSSLRYSTNVPGAIVKPAKKSNHLVGHAIDCNLLDVITGKLWTSKELKKPSGSIKNFLSRIGNGNELRWGGNFPTPDEVHFDDGLNIRNPAKWEALYIEVQKKRASDKESPI